MSAVSKTDKEGKGQKPRVLVLLLLLFHLRGKRLSQPVVLMGVEIREYLSWWDKCLTPDSKKQRKHLFLRRCVIILKKQSFTVSMLVENM